ncbi:beta-lactamase family protein [Burkholderiaceae bacterium FT117]|uniref:serine hydrolase domain-containing protein n=1 Tax=Zeimonas sediminis TaxID=2944268 RepID=UPI002342C906|nr:serine hydrolase domain-containing protein [Zeimonas sediminis]MCM5571422.1 beta-lactamase family protein [Zeimonas sediminis]
MTLPEPAALRAALDPVLSESVSAGEVPGIAALVVDRGGTVYENAFGVRTMGGQAPMGTDTVGWIASMTKAITGAAVMQAVERGLLDLDAPAGSVAPEIDTIGVLDGFDPEGTPRFRPPKRPVTLRDLLTHTSGFSYERWSDDVWRCHQALGIPANSTCKLATLRSPLMFDPGERWEYGIGIDWAGRLLEIASGRKLGDWMRDEILAPLGMDDTAFRIGDAMRARLAKMHQRDATGAIAPLPDFEIPQEPEFEMGGGGLYSTAADYARFLRMILNRGELDGRRVLRAETVAQMSTDQIPSLEVQPLLTRVPSLSNDAEFFPGLSKGWGLSFMINRAQAPTGRPAGSLAWAGLSNCYYWIDPANGIAGVFVSQLLPFADRLALPRFLAFEKAVYDAMRGR